MNFKCNICGNEHNEEILDLAFQKPDVFFEIPTQEISQRVWFNSEYNADICMIDRTRFFIRGILPIPICLIEQEFRFGIWCEVEEEYCKRYYELWDENDVSNEPNFEGLIANQIPLFKKNLGVKTNVKLQSNNQRPLFFVKEKESEISMAQVNGISLEEVHQIIDKYGR